ncbi:MAG: alpha/beta hydrolase domain-containing protein [Candidatus Nanopelagicales bacterium]
MGTRAALAAIAALTVTAAAMPMTAAAADDAPATVTSSPIPGGTFFTAALQDLAESGYREGEYALELSGAHIYEYVAETIEVVASPAPPSPKGAYRSRMIVRLPDDPADFNGRVLVEMMNTTTTVDLDVAWEQAHEYLMREGWGYVGVTVQQTGLDALTRFRPEPNRYTGLDLNLMTPEAAPVPLYGLRDPSLAWDLTSAVGRLVTSNSVGGPFDGYTVRSTYLTGQSQMAGYAVTYINAIHPRDQIFDGFLVAYRGTRATNLGFVAPEAGSAPVGTSTSVAQRRIDGGGTPVINLQTESDPLDLPGGGDEAVWRDDASTPTDRFRLWEVAGSSHNDRWGSQQALDILSRDYGLPFTPACDWVAPMGINDFPMRFAWHAALEALAGWHETDAAPALAPRLVRVDGAIVRDARGNARGGIRLPPADVPVATRGPISTGGLFCNLTGYQKPFPRKILKARYPKKAEYVDQVRRAGRADARSGVLLIEDAADLVRQARRGPAADGQTIRDY